MKVKEILNTLTILDRVVIYERRQGDFGPYVSVFFEGQNEFDMGLDKNILQRDVIMLTVEENRLLIMVDGDEDET